MKVSGVALLALGAQRVGAQTGQTDVESCAALILAVENSNDISLSSGFSCDEQILITSGSVVTIEGNGETITFTSFDDGLDSGSSSLFYNKGTLTINSVTFSEDNSSGSAVRAIRNENELAVHDCTFSSLGIRSSVDERIQDGGAIYSDTDGHIVVIESSTFSSNLASSTGGAIGSMGTGTLTITDSSFLHNEVDDGSTDSTAQGGDVYAARGVTLEVVGSNFTGGTAEFAGASIWCCGGSISNSIFKGTETSSPSGNYGAVTSNLPGETDCGTLTVESCEFTNCRATETKAKGGSLAIFNTEASIVDSFFNNSTGTAVVCESSSAEGHSVTMDNVQFNHNEDGATEFASDDDIAQGTAVVITNTATDDFAPTGNLMNVFCYANVPYECEVIYNQVEVTHGGEQKCNICNLAGEKIESELDYPSSSSGGSSSGNKSAVIGLSCAVAVMVLVVGYVGFKKYKVSQNTQRLMGGDHDI